MATLKDVAKDAGVSIATVSCCLSGAKNVKPETKSRVMDSIEKLKYIPNASARSLKSSASRKIGVVLTDIDNSYHSDIFKGISSYLQNKAYNISVAFSNNSPDIECEKINDFTGDNVSGLLIITSQPRNSDFFESRIKNYNIPAVFIERRPDNLDVSFAGFDNFRTAYYLTQRLIENGFRNIALITGSRHFSSESEARNGYETAMQDYGLSPDPALIHTTDMTKEDAFKVLFRIPEPDRIEAIITTSESIAQGAAEACRILGLRFPGDIQILTFGEESWSQAGSAPGILRTKRTAFTLGREAAKLLLENIEAPVLFEPRTLLFTDEIVHSEIKLSAPKIKKTPAALPKASPLRILMVDLSTSHSTKLLSVNFTMLFDIPVEIDFVPQNELLSAIIRDQEQSEPHYDIYMYDVPWLGYMVQNGLVADITDYIQGENFHMDFFFPANMENCKYDDRYFGIPIIGGSQIMFYRKDLFDNRTLQNAFKNKYQIPLRPPRTWTEFNGVASFFTRSFNPLSPTPYGTSMAGIVDEEFAPEILIRLWASGGKLWDKYNRACIDTPENEQAIRSILQTLQYVEASPLETSIDRTVSDFCNGKTAMLITYTEYANKIRTDLHDIVSGRVGYTPIPGRAPASIGWNLGINPYTTKTKEAFWYFKWLCQKNISIYMTILDGQSPATPPYHSHELLKLYPWLELTEESFQYCRKRTGPYSRNSLIMPQSRIEAILCQVMKEIITENASVTDALRKGQADMAALFKSYGYPKPLHFLP